MKFSTVAGLSWSNSCTCILLPGAFVNKPEKVNVTMVPGTMVNIQTFRLANNAAYEPISFADSLSATYDLFKFCACTVPAALLRAPS